MQNENKVYCKKEKTLIKKIAEDRDKKSFELLYKNYYQRIYQFIFRLTKKNEITEEVINDTFFVVWEKIKYFEHKSELSTWIHGIAYRIGLKALEKHKRNLRLIDKSDEVNLSDIIDINEESNPEIKAINNRSYRDLLEKIDNLSDSHQSVVTLCAQGYSYQEISCIINCPENTVKTRMFYAKKLLLKKITENNKNILMYGYIAIH